MTRLVLAGLTTVVLLAGCTSADVAPPSAAPTSTIISAAPTTPSVPLSYFGVTAAGSVSFNGVTITRAQDLAKAPEVRSSASGDPSALLVEDLVVGSGRPVQVSDTTSVTVRYVAVRYADGTVFDSTWTDGKPATVPLNGVVPGFAQAITGTEDTSAADSSASPSVPDAVPPMRVGGRRVMIVPSVLAYGATGDGSDVIGPNTPVVFVVDLVATP